MNTLLKDSLDLLIISIKLLKKKLMNWCSKLIIIFVDTTITTENIWLNLPCFVFYKSHIKPNMELCCYTWAGATQFAFPELNRVQNDLHALLWEYSFSSLHPLSRKHNVAKLSVFYGYFHGKYPVELHSLVPPVQIFITKLRSRITYISSVFQLQVKKSTQTAFCFSSKKWYFVE